MAEKIGHSGFINGETSAFLLDFGPILVVEFSKVGNACYIYERHWIDNVIPNFWTSQPLMEYKLKQSHICIEKISHRNGWEGNMAGVLARYGIRPG